MFGTYKSAGVCIGFGVGNKNENFSKKFFFYRGA